MKIKYSCLQIVISAIALLSSELVFGQDTLDHNIFINQINSSSADVYKECIRKYDSCLLKHPAEVKVMIEKCKFIQLAQYNEDEEYNPNQKEYDSCLAYLIRLYPVHPDVLVYQTSLLWDDELKEIFSKSEESIRESPEQWSKNNLGALYSKMAEQYYDDNNYKSAAIYIKKAIANDDKYKGSLNYVRILIKTDKKELALSALLNSRDSGKEVSFLQQKADLLLELKAYPEALNTYNAIDKIDSSYNNNFEISSTLSAVGEYEQARNYLIADTAKNWNKENALKNLLIHDLDHKDGNTCITTYNRFRDLGYSADPLAIYRIRLFISHPLHAWKIRDISGLITLLIVFLTLIILPYVWILPIYFIGHQWNLIDSKKSQESLWGLKMFWMVSTGYLIASLLAYMCEPAYLYSLLNNSHYSVELSQEKGARISLIFIVIYGIFGFFSLYKIDLRILLSKNWSVIKSILIGFGILIAFKVVSVIYLKLGMSIPGIPKNDLFALSGSMISSRQDIEAIIASYGKGTGFFLICLFVPLYEEIIFRGVILDSAKKYTNFGAANIIQALFFSILHFNLFLIPVYFLFGIITGLMRKKAGGLLPGIVFHSFNNFLAIILIILR
jgi:CAAX protease family protein